MKNLKPIDPAGNIEEQIKQHQLHRVETGEPVHGCYCAGCIETKSVFKPKARVKDNTLNEDSMFTAEEEATFDLNIEYRKALLKDIFKDGIPKHNSTIRVVNELLSSVDSALLTRSKTRYAIIANKEEQAANAETTDILKSVIQARMDGMVGNQQPIVDALPEKYTKEELNEGALKLGHDKVNPKDFFGDE